MGDNKRLLQFHEQKLSDLEAFKFDTQMFQKNASASLKNLETQVGKLALNMPNQSKGTFPSDTQKNPKDFMAIQLRSGKDLSINKRTERKEETEAEKEETEKEGRKSTQIEQPKGSNDQKKMEGVLAYTPSIPFPQRLQKSRREEQFSKFLDIFCHAPIPGPTRLADQNRVRGARLRTGTLYLIFFLKVNLYLWVWPTSYNRIKILYTNQKNYHRSGVHQNLDTYN